MSQYLRTMPPWPNGQPLPAGAITFFYDPGTDKEYQIDPARFGGSGTSSLPTINLLDLTTAQILEVIALTYTDCDADPAASPAWSYPGQYFDAKVNGENRHYYCSRGTFDPTAPAGTTGAGPAWHYFQKLG